jgi:hypothetical protein
MSHERLLTFAGVAAAVIVLGFLSLRIHLPLEFERPCRLLPQAEWLLMRTGPDSFEARLIERETGERQSFALYRFERGDRIRFDLAEGVRPGRRVAAGEEIATLRSRLNRTQLETLRLELREAQASLTAAETGEKSEIVAQARGEVEVAEALVSQRRSEYERATRLRESDLLPDADHEIAESGYRQAEAALAAARSRLRAAEVGEKEAIVAAFRARVDLLSGQIREAQTRLDEERLCSPLAGEIITLQADSALVRVADTDTLFALAPIPPSRAAALRVGGGAVVEASGSVAVALDGRIVAIDGQASTISGRTFFWVTVALPNLEQAVAPGLQGTLRFSGEPVSLLAWVVDRLRHAADRTLGA